MTKTVFNSLFLNEHSFLIVSADRVRSQYFTSKLIMVSLYGTRLAISREKLS